MLTTPYGNIGSANQLADLLLKSLSTTESSPLIRQDLELQAYNTQYNSTKPNELRLLKLLPRIKAEAVNHMYVRIAELAGNSGSGFFAERALPQSGALRTYQVTNPIRLVGEVAQVYKLAQMESGNVVRALGANDVAMIQAKATRLALLRKLNKQLFTSNPDLLTHAGVTVTQALRFYGIKRQIIRGTTAVDNAMATSNFNSGNHLIDLRGQPITTRLLRHYLAEIGEQFGCPSTIFMPPRTTENFEDELAAQQRAQIPTNNTRHMIGMNVGGMNTANGEVYFEIDNILSPQYYQGTPVKYTNTTATNPATPSTPAVHVDAKSTVAPDASSLFDEADAGIYHYAISFLKDEVESFARIIGTGGTIVSAAGVAAGENITIAAGDRVALAITAVLSDATAPDALKIYRTMKGGALTGPYYCIGEYAVQDTAEHTYYDVNAVIAGTSEVFCLNLESSSAHAFRNSVSYRQAVLDLGEPAPRAQEGNTVWLATLGPFMGTFNLAMVLFLALNDLLYMACTPQVVIPSQNFVFTNVGVGLDIA